MSFFATIYDDRKLPHRAKVVYMYLRDRADAEGKCWPAVKTIAADLNISRATVQRALADLERAGYIVRKARRRDNGGSTSNLYTVNMEKNAPC